MDFQEAIARANELASEFVVTAEKLKTDLATFLEELDKSDLRHAEKIAAATIVIVAMKETNND